MITWSALTPLRESVSALPAPAYRQEGGASSRLAREKSLGICGREEVVYFRVQYSEKKIKGRVGPERR